MGKKHEILTWRMIEVEDHMYLLKSSPSRDVTYYIKWAILSKKEEPEGFFVERLAPLDDTDGLYLSDFNFQITRVSAAVLKTKNGRARCTYYDLEEAKKAAQTDYNT